VKIGAHAARVRTGTEIPSLAVGEVKDEIEREHSEALKALERAERERQKAEEAERKAEEERKSAAARAKAARETADRKSAEEASQPARGTDHPPKARPGGRTPAAMSARQCAI
jgi:membrane protein involved in colicin uptake